MVASAPTPSASPYPGQAQPMASGTGPVQGMASIDQSTISAVVAGILCEYISFRNEFIDSDASISNIGLSVIFRNLEYHSLIC